MRVIKDGVLSGTCCQISPHSPAAAHASLRLSAARGLSTIAQPKVTNKQVPGLKNGMDYVQLGDSDLVVSKVCSKLVHRED